MGAEPGGSRGDTAARVLVLASAGVLGALAFPKTSWAPLAWIWLVPALVSGATRPRRAALRDGWLSGTVFYVVLLRWLDHTFLHYSAIPGPTWLPIVALLRIAASTWAWSRAGGLAPGTLGRARPWRVEPSLWWWGSVPGWLMGGFPGVDRLLAARQLPLIQIAELGGVYAGPS